MKLRFFTTLLCFLFTYSAFSQIYHSILDETDFEYWNHEFEDIYCTDYYVSIAENLDWDVIGNVQKAFFSPYSSNDSSRYLLENSFGQVWYFHENNFSTPQLIYDFSLNEGDTTSVITGTHFGSGYHSTRIVVTETDNYISPFGTTHKRLHIEHIDYDVWYPYNVWIEGIGAISGGLLYTLAPSDPHIELNKVWKAGELIYDQQKYCGVVDCNVYTPNETSTTENTLNLTWVGTLETEPMYFEVDTRVAGSAWQTQNVEANTAYITDMQENTLYEWRVRKFCNGYYSAYSEERQFLNDPMSVQSIEQVGISLWYNNNVIHIKRPNEQSTSFFVYDINGKLVHTQNIEQNTSININLPYGVYVGFFQENSGKQYSGKFVVAD